MNLDPKDKALPKGSPLPDDLHARLTDLVQVEGERAARSRVRLSRTAFARCLAKLPVYQGTIALVRAGLSVP